MNVLRLLIARPIAVLLLVFGFVLSGCIAYILLPVAFLPSFSIPTIQVITDYPGASPEVMATHVTAPLENQLGKMQDVSKMTSTSSYGSSLITLQFTPSIDLDVAGQEVQAAVNTALTYLPLDLPTPPLYFKINPTEAPIFTLGLTSKKFPLPQVNTLAESRMVPIIAELTGMGRVSLAGNQTFAIRIQVNPTALAANNLSLEDVRTAISNANILGAQGSLDDTRLSYMLNSNDQLITADDYRALIVAYRNNAPLRLKDVATVSNSTENIGALSAHGVVIAIQRQPGANTLEMISQIKKILPQIAASLPVGVDMKILNDDSINMLASIRAMKWNLLFSFVFLIIALYFYYRSFMATMIASSIIPISLMITFGGMYVLGCNFDNITLIALTLSMGLVLNNSVLTINSVSRNIVFLMVALTLSLLTVVAPQFFLNSIVSPLFREFAITILCAVIISLVVSLTFIPMLISRFPQPPISYSAPNSYGTRLQWVLRNAKLISNLLLVVSILTVGWLYIYPKGFSLTPGEKNDADYQYSISSPDNGDLSHWAPLILGQFKSLKSIVNVRIDENNTALQTHLQFDRDTASRLGITAELFDNVLYDAFGQRQISTVYTQANQYHVVLEVLPIFKQSTTGLNSIYFNSSAGPIPLAVFTRASQSSGPVMIHRQNQFSSVNIVFNLAKKVSLSEATQDISTAIKALKLPVRISGNFDDSIQAFQYFFQGEAWLLLATLVLVYIIFGILYESLLLPIVVLSTLPITLMGSLFVLFVFHQPINAIYLLGIIIVLGMGMKNAVMIISSALELQKQSAKTAYDAVYQACTQNFKIIQVTTWFSVVAALPLVFNMMAGEELRCPIGWVVVGGLIISHYLSLYTVPAIYLFFSKDVKSS